MLSKTDLKDKIITELHNIGFTSGTYSWFEKFAQAIANAIVDEIQTNAEVNVSSGTHSGHSVGDGSHTHIAGTIK